MNLSRVQCSLVVSNEISNVATALRQSVRWENDYEEPLEDTLFEEFVSLQQKVLYMRQWEVVDPFEYVAPFLDAIRSEKVGAAITSTALAALWKLLTSNVLPASHHNSAQTLKHIVTALEGCRFQAASNSAHEAVVTRLVQVFAACVCADVGVLLSSDDVLLVTMSIWKWCDFSPTSESMMKTSGIFLQSVRQSLQQLISCLFSRLRTCRVIIDDIQLPGDLTDPTADLGGTKRESAFQATGLPYDLADDAIVANLCCGLEPFQDILSYCTEPMLMESDDESHADRILFVLQMLHTAIVHAGETLAEYEELLTVIRCIVFPALTICLHRTSQRVHAAVFQVVFAMYKLFGDMLMLQIECFFQTSVLRLCEGRGCPTQEHQEIALEALLDFCGYPGFLRDIYLNLDCRIERSNLFEDICSLLSKTAFPVKTPLYAVHMISMEGILAMFLTLSSACGGEGAPMTSAEPKPELPCYIDIWSDIFGGVSPKLDKVMDPELVLSEDGDVLRIRLEKEMKKRIALAVDHFNRDFKKGFQYLQSIHLLPEERDAEVIAKFLRVCPNLNGHVVGEMLGDADEFYQSILEHFTKTFDFTGKTIDAALRLYFDAFKVPGEAQKIDRVVTQFSKVFFACQHDNTFKNEDAVHILAYSIIMLNTDLHKPEIKNKMTVDQFVRNNRGINDREDFPRQMLERIYSSIKEQPMRIADGGYSDFSPVRWSTLNQMSRMPRGQKAFPLKSGAALDKDMFTLIWGPSVAAISVILDQADDSTTVQTTLTGLKLAAKIAFFHGVDEVIDSLVVSLFKSTQLLAPRVPKALVLFGMKEEAQLATEAAFFIANKYTSSLGSPGWRSVMDCVIRLSQLDILPPHFWEDAENEADGLSEPTFEMYAESTSSAGASGVSATLWPWAKADSPLTDEERAAQQRALQCIQRCEIRVVFRDTKFLKLESLIELIKAVCSASSADEKTSLVCMELVFYITLRNRDRIQHVWPEIETQLEKILNTEPKFPAAIIEATVFGILRVCQRCLTRKGLSGIMLRILQMVPAIGDEILNKISDRLAEEILGLIRLAAPVIEEGWAWDAICRLLRATARTERAKKTGRETVNIIARNGEHVTAENFSTVLETLKCYNETTYSTADELCMSVDAVLDMVTSLTTWPLTTPRTSQFKEDNDALTAERTSLWIAAFLHLKSLSIEQSADVRNHAVLALQRCVMMGETLNMSMETWRKILRKDIMDLVLFLTKKQSSRDYPEVDKTLTLALKVLARTFLQFLNELKKMPDFSDIWMKILYLLQQSCTGRDDELSDAVPEETKNLLLVMHKEGILLKTWKDDSGISVWDATWRKAREISFALKPDVLQQ